jgi:hypothetical protein
MAERRPCFSDRNLALDAATVITASSQDVYSGFGLVNLRDPTPTNQWRSLPGWNVGTWNNKVYFTEAGNARVGTIASGNYSTRDAYGDAVRAAMDAAPGHVNTYAITAPGGVFSFALATGSTAWAFNLGTSNQAANYPDMGFDPGTMPELTFQDADYAVYKSREWVKFETGGGYDHVVLAHVGDDASPHKKIYLQIENTDAFTNIPADPSEEMTFGSNGNANRPVCAVTIFPNVEGEPWVRVVFDARREDVAYSEMGLASIAAVYEPSRSFAQGWRRRSLPLTTFATSESGGIMQNPQPQPAVFEMTFRRLSDSDRVTLEALEQRLRIGGSFFVWLDPLNQPLNETWYVVMERALEYEHNVGDGPTADRWSVSFLLRQHL